MPFWIVAVAKTRAEKDSVSLNQTISCEPFWDSLIFIGGPLDGRISVQTPEKPVDAAEGAAACWADSVKSRGTTETRSSWRKQIENGACLSRRSDKPARLFEPRGTVTFAF